MSRVEKDGRGNVWVEKKTGEESSWVAELTGENCPGGELYGYNFNMMITILSTTRHHKTFLNLCVRRYLFIISRRCSYQNGWKELATSANSEKQVGEYSSFLLHIVACPGGLVHVLEV